MSTVFYIKNFFQDKNIGSITPTSRISVKRVCRHIDFKKARVIVEYGPGAGVFTKYLLKHLDAEGCIIAIEANKNFARFLKDRFQDPRLIVVNDSAENVLKILEKLGKKHADYILSGIPFSFFNLELKRRIIANTSKALSAQGRFVVYQFYPRPLRRKKRLKIFLMESFGRVRTGLAPWNIPPLRIFVGLRPGKARKEVSKAS